MNKATEIRLKLLDLGYEPLANRNKICPIRHWSKIKITRELIQSRKWARSSTLATVGIRCGRVAGLDVDIEDPVIRKAVLDIIDDVVGLSPFQRVGKRPLFVYKVRREGWNSGKHATGKWLRGDESFAVEVLGKGFQFGAYGPHSKDIEYSWPDKSLLDTPRRDLPAITTAQRIEIVERSIELFKEQGDLIPHSRKLAGESYTWEHQLEGDMVFNVHGIGQMTVDEMEQMLRAGTPELRCCMSAVREGADNDQTGQASILGDKLVITDHSDLKLYDRKRREFYPELAAPPEEETLRDCSELRDKVTRNDLVDQELTNNGNLSRVQPLTMPNLDVVVDALELYPRWNLMTSKPEVPGVACDYSAVEEAVIDELARCGVKDRQRICTLLEMRAKAHPYHPMEDWLKALEWDGRSRIEAVAASVTTQQPELWPVYLKHWLIQGVQAVCGWRDPKQVGSVLTLTGEQGIGKTSWLRSLVPEQWFKEGAHLSLVTGNTKDSIIEALERPVVELGELDGSFRRSDSASLKNFLTRPLDTIRRPYAKAAETKPRMTIYCASVNLQQVLADETGNRRYWPVHCTRIERHNQSVAQLWAEAYALWSRGYQWWLEPEYEEKRIVVEREFHVEDEATLYFRQRIEPYLKRVPTEYMTIYEVARAIEMPINNVNTRKLTALLTQHFGPRKAAVKIGDGYKYRCWKLPKMQGSLTAIERSGFDVIDGSKEEDDD